MINKKRNTFSRFTDFPEILNRFHSLLLIRTEQTWTTLKKLAVFAENVPFILKN